MIPENSSALPVCPGRALLVLICFYLMQLEHGLYPAAMASS